MTAALPGWADMTELDGGAALMHLHKRDWEGWEYAVENYPARYFDNPALLALSPQDASAHAASLADADGLIPGVSLNETDRLYDLALDADRARRDAEREASAP